MLVVLECPHYELETGPRKVAVSYEHARSSLNLRQGQHYVP